MREAEFPNRLRRCAAVLMRLMEDSACHYFFQAVSDIFVEAVAFSGLQFEGLPGDRVISLLHVFQRLRNGAYVAASASAASSSSASTALPSTSTRKRGGGHDAFAADVRSVFANAAMIARAKRQVLDAKAAVGKAAAVEWRYVGSFEEWNAEPLDVVAHRLLGAFDALFAAWVVNPGIQAGAGPWGAGFETFEVEAEVKPARVARVGE
jgi:hypothetical protein